MGWMAQRVPFHRSASVRPGKPGGPKVPTAVQARAAVQDTPSRALALGGGAGLGVAWIAQRMPFHRSASVNSLPAVLSQLPAAVQAFAEVQDTPGSGAKNANPAGVGVGWICQRVPFHASARGKTVWALLMEYPVAVQASAEVHDTPASAAFLLGGLGVAWIPQRVPFHRSAKVSRGPPFT